VYLRIVALEYSCSNWPYVAKPACQYANWTGCNGTYIILYADTNYFP